ncbi:MAG: HIT domain-containing protein [Desulfurococcaceae archaeon]
MQILWNPWRYEYIKKFTSKHKTEECLFCRVQGEKDEDALILHRGSRAFVLLNAYPYNTGHLMIASYKHTGDILELDEETLLEMMILVKKSMKVLREAFKPDGFNIGANIGRAAGAGIPDHFHVHVVPRWVGDTNFIAIIANTKPLPMALHESYSLLKSIWNKV